MSSIQTDTKELQEINNNKLSKNNLNFYHFSKTLTMTKRLNDFTT